MSKNSTQIYLNFVVGKIQNRTLMYQCASAISKSLSLYLAVRLMLYVCNTI